MIIDKEIISKTYREYFFITGMFDIDAQYFKNKIDEGIQTTNLNYKTNVMGQQTGWKFFNNDKNFVKLMTQVLDYLEHSSLNLEPCHLESSWGIIEGFGEFTKKHNHNPNYFSGVLYLHNHSQKLYFPEINQETTPAEGRVVLFSSFLKHYTKRNLEDAARYAVSFNFFYN
ncbi:MAG TPA: hypothetical protein DCS66_09260 [Flavobacteriaceae bacterium]|nr:hypothetical protein [Flavobacteriaceae bacterium]